MSIYAKENQDGTKDLGNAGVLDGDDQRINPAIEEKQDDIISAIGAIPTTDVSALATEDTLLDIKNQYKISDLADGNTSYFGFLKSDGSWYIMSLTETEARYVKGDDDYSTNWTDRESLTYDYYNNIF
jgi:glycosyltransferase A (GT-A) superfamily protein (DUF2064 family)